MNAPTAPQAGLDLGAYLQRIGYSGPTEPTRAALEALHLAHATHIPFENLDILLGRPVRLDLESLQGKLVRDRRGGYCFEQNLLFSTALEQLGFRVTRLAARVRYRNPRLMPRMHMTMLVRVDEVDWLADVGFGAEGLLHPVRFDPATPTRQYAWTYRVAPAPEPGTWMLQSLRGEAWTDLYSFSLEAQLPVDYEVPNYFVSTHPDSRFVQTLTAQRVAPEARHVLRNRELIIDRGAEVTSRVLAGDDELLAALAEVFELRFPAGTRFRYREAGK